MPLSVRVGLQVYFPIFLIFGTVFRKPLIRMMKFFHRKLDETGIM